MKKKCVAKELKIDFSQRRNEPPPSFTKEEKAEMLAILERGRYLDMIEIVQNNPSSSCLPALKRASKDGTLKRLGIDWKP